MTEQDSVATRNKRTVADFIDRINREGIGVAVRSLPETASWWAGGVQRGKPEMTELLSQIEPMFASPLAIAIHNMTADEDRVAVEASSGADLTNGRRYTNDYHFLFRLDNAGIREVREHCDTQRAAQAFGM